MYAPKFNYTELDTTTIDGKRFYCVGKKKYPSITTILSATEDDETLEALEKWRESMGREAADAYTKDAANHGTHLHLLCERYFKNEELFAPDEDGNAIMKVAIESFNSLKFKLQSISDVWGIEVPLYSNMLGVAGRCDLIAKYKGVSSIIDYKTSTRIKHKDDIGNYAVQLAFYAIAHNELFDTNIEQGVILMACKTGIPLEFKFNVIDHVDELVDRIEQFYENYK